MQFLDTLRTDGIGAGAMAPSQTAAARRRSLDGKHTADHDDRLPNLCPLLVSSSSTSSHDVSGRLGAQCHGTHQVMGQGIPQNHRFHLPQTADKEPLKTTVAGQGIHAFCGGGPFSVNDLRLLAGHPLTPLGHRRSVVRPRSVGVPLGIFRFQKQSFTSTEFDAYKDVCRRVLAKFGRRPPSRVESLARRLTRSLPDSWRPRTGLGYPVWHIVRDDEAEQFVRRRSWIV